MESQLEKHLISMHANDYKFLQDGDTQVKSGKLDEIRT